MCWTCLDPCWEETFKTAFAERLIISPQTTHEDRKKDRLCGGFYGVRDKLVFKSDGASISKLYTHCGLYAPALYTDVVGVAVVAVVFLLQIGHGCEGRKCGEGVRTFESVPSFRLELSVGML